MRARLIPRALVGLAVLLTLSGGCATGGGPTTTGRNEPAAEPRASTRQIDPQHAERLKRVMVPLIRAMNSPKPLDQVRVALVDDPHVNAANAGGGQFYVTTGLMEKANDRQLAGVLAHEVAHDDLGHVAKQQALQTGLGIGVVILDQVFPGSRAVTPIAGTLVARGYSRNEEYAADRHGVTILGRAGDADPRGTMLGTLTWLTQTEGAGGGGWFSTHPGTEDRIDAIRKL
jgi:predicted Zn-dependent protease